MYETHFGFHRQPFQCADPSRAFYRSESIRGILPSLIHSLRSSLGLALVTGPRGVGRTTLLRYLQQTFENEARAIIIPGASLVSVQELQRSVLMAALRHAGTAGQSQSPDAYTGRWSVVEQLRRTLEFWGPVVILLDDCQLVPTPVLNELRAFSEEEWNGRGLVRILMTAPVTFEEDLGRPGYADLAQRIRCHTFLQPLRAQEAIEFLKTHLEAVGGALTKALTPEAVELLIAACDGLPRSLSLLADETFVIAADSGTSPADPSCVRRALDRLKHLPLHWNMSVFEDAAELHSVSARTSTGFPVAEIASGSAGVIEFGSGSSSFWTVEDHAPRPVVESPVEPVRADSVVTVPGISDERPASVPDEGIVSSRETDLPSFVTGTAFETGLRFDPDARSTPTMIESLVSADSVVDYTDHQNTIPNGFFTELELDSVIGFDHQDSQPTLEIESVVEEARTVLPETPMVVPPSVQFFEGNRESVRSDLAQSGARESERSVADNLFAGLSNRIPVFDRYTWQMLGRDVPTGRHLVSSPSAQVRRSPEPAPGITKSRHTIPVTASSDRDVMSLLWPADTQPVEGLFVAADALTAPAVPTDVVTAFQEPVSEGPLQSVQAGSATIDVMETPTDLGSNPELSVGVRTEENRVFINEAIRQTLGSAAFAVSSQSVEQVSEELLAPALTWRDGSLIFPAALTATPNGVSDEQPQIGPTETVSGEHEAGTSPKTTNGQPDELFTIPVKVGSLAWDLRSSVIDFGEVTPLAESVSSLQTELAGFHSGIWNSDVVPPPLPNVNPAPGLVDQARIRIAAAESAQSGSRTLPEAELPPNTGQEPSPEPQPEGSLSTLFTRLRTLRTYRKDEAG